MGRFTTIEELGRGIVDANKIKVTTIDNKEHIGWLYGCTPAVDNPSNQASIEVSYTSDHKYGGWFFEENIIKTIEVLE